MSRGKIEIQVIDDKLLLDGLLAGRPISESDVLKGSGEVNLVDLAPTVKTLVLSFKKIGKIENLVGFESLTKLCLDNNCIDTIVSLGHLKKLKWLDLSFNKIQKIQGLENLVNLEDLSLYSNRISVVEGLEQCKKLMCLSLGNNRIEELEKTVLTIRKLRSIKMLTLVDNPICAEGDYEKHVLAYVDGVKYLDYSLVDQAKVDNAKAELAESLGEIEEADQVNAQTEAQEQQLEQLKEQLDKAGILFAHTLYDDMFNDDEDIEKLKHIKAVNPLCETDFRTPLKAWSEEFIAGSLQKYKEKCGEIGDFDGAVAAIRAKDDSESMRLIEQFAKSKKIVVEKLTDENETVSKFERHMMVKDLQDELDAKCDELMNIELRLVDKFDALIDRFEDKMNEMKNVALEQQSVFFRRVEAFEDNFSTKLKDLCLNLIERNLNGEFNDDFFDEVASLLVGDKDTCMTVVGASHDRHIGAIVKNEDAARSTETKRCLQMLENYRSSERSRNRNRILEIHDFSRQSKGSLMALLSMDEEEGDEDDLHAK